jgi:hypothetical protein
MDSELLHKYELFWRTYTSQGKIRYDHNGVNALHQIKEIRALPMSDDKLIILDDDTRFKLSEVNAEHYILLIVKPK